MNDRPRRDRPREPWDEKPDWPHGQWDERPEWPHGQWNERPDSAERDWETATDLIRNRLTRVLFGKQPRTKKPDG